MEKLTEVGGYKLNHASWAQNDEDLPAPAADAVTLMAQTIEENAGEIAICALGPLTNVAVLLRRHPELAPKIRHIAIMGGELELNRREHNVSWDAIAAEIVFTSGRALICGDVERDAPVRFERRRLRAHQEFGHAFGRGFERVHRACGGLTKLGNRGR